MIIGNVISLTQYQDLIDNKLLINKYDGNLKYAYELENTWKVFIFDIISEMTKSDKVTILKSKDLINTLRSNYKKIIDIYQLNTDIEDYPDLVDYISFNKWKENNKILRYDEDYILLTQNNLITKTVI